MKDTIIEVNSGTLDTVVSKVENALSEVATQLGVASDHFYPIIVLQKQLEGWILLAGGVPTLLIASLFMWVVYKEGSKNREVIGWFLGAITCYIMGVVLVIQGLPQVVNPEFAALMEIKSFIK